METRQEFLELLHFIGGKRRRCGLKVGESAVELFDAVTVAPPMKGLMADDVLECLGHHGTLHRVVVVTFARGRRESCEVPVVCRSLLHVSPGHTQIPCEAVESTVDMTGGATYLPEAGAFLSVIEM